VPLAIDHVLIPVDYLAAAGAIVKARYGLTSIEGGRHPGWGTANRVIPLGDAYVELVAVVDRDAAALSTFGRWILGATPGQPLGWAVRTRAIAEVGQRLGLSIAEGSRTTPDGDVLEWRSAGLDEATAEPGLPFFIEWADGVRLPGAAPVHHPSGNVQLRRLSLAADPARLALWLGPNELQLPLSVKRGRSGVVSVVLAHAEQEFSIRI
jgi:glyoxalase-like protein